MKEINYNELLNLFVSNREIDRINRPYFLQPFKQKDYYYATDAHAAIQLPASIVTLDYEERAQPKNIADLFEIKGTSEGEIDTIKLSNQLKPRTIDETEECELKCLDCNGEGTQECDMGYEHTCPECDGKGDYVSSRKTGKKIPNKKTPFQLNGTAFQYQNLKKLVDAAEILGKKKVKMFSTGKNKQVNFEIDYIKIIIMPLMDASGAIKM